MIISKEKKDLQVFGYGLGLIGAVFGIGAWVRHGLGLPAIVLIVCSIIFVATTALDSTALKPGYRGWMKVAHVIGSIVTTVILGLAFFLIFTPIGILLKLTGRDHLQRDFSKKDKTYWVKRDVAEFTKDRYHQQF